MENLEKYYNLYEAKDYKKQFYTYTYNDIINHFIECNIYIIDNYKHLKNEFENIILNMKDIEQKKKVLPLILFLGEKFYLNLLSNHFFDDVKEYIFSEFEQLLLKIDLNKFAKYSYEYEYLSMLNTKLNANNYNELYNFSLSFNITNYQYADFLYHFAIKYDFNRYYQVLDKKDIFTFLNFVLYLDEKYKVQIKEKICKYKFIINIFLLKNNVLKNNHTTTKDILKYFSGDTSNWDLILELIFKNLRNDGIYIILIQIVSTLNKEKVEVVIKHLDIENNIDKFFFNINNKDYQNLIAKELYKKWKNYIKQNRSIIDMSLTSFINIIIVYIHNNYTQKNRKRMIDKILCILDNIDNIWFANKTKQQEYLFYLLTKLFVFKYKIDYKTKEINEIYIK